MPGSPRSLVTLSRRRFGQCVAAWAGASALARPRSSALAAARTGDLVGEVTYHLTGSGRNLLDLARERNLGVPEISALNPGVDPWVPADETLVTLPTRFILPDAPREGIVVNYGELRLFHFLKHGRVETYAIGVGRDGFELKMGQTKIVRKKERPTWYPTESTLRDKPWVGKVVPPGPDNPLGEYALYLGWPTYLIHGTNLPYGVGRRVSRGCIRMYPEGMARLYPQVAPGTKVTAVDQRVKVGWHEGELYLEVQPDMAQLDELEATQAMTPRAPEPGDRQRVVDRAGPDAARVDWAVVEAELVSRRGIPVQITRPRPVVADRYGAPSAGPSPGESLPPPVIVRRGGVGGGLY